MSFDSEDKFYKEHKVQIDSIAEHYKAILSLLGEDVSREGLRRTPFRAAKALVETTQGYEQNPVDLMGSILCFPLMRHLHKSMRMQMNLVPLLT